LGASAGGSAGTCASAGTAIAAAKRAVTAITWNRERMRRVYRTAAPQQVIFLTWPPECGNMGAHRQQPGVTPSTLTGLETLLRLVDHGGAAFPPDEPIVAVAAA